MLESRRRKPKIDHSGGMDHSGLLDEILANYGRYGIPHFLSHYREKFFEKDGGLSAEPDLVLFHKFPLITIIEAKTSPYNKTRSEAIEQLERDKAFFEGLGCKVKPMWVYMKRGKPKYECPAEFILKELGEQTY